jgi:hypothetical protein
MGFVFSFHLTGPHQEMGVLSKPSLHISKAPKKVQISFPKAQDHTQSRLLGDSG